MRSWTVFASLNPCRPCENAVPDAGKDSRSKRGITTKFSLAAPLSVVVLAMLFSFTASAEDPTPIYLAAPIVLSGFKNGAVFDYTNETLIATKPMPFVLFVDGTKNPDPGWPGQTFTVTVKLGIVDGNGFATDGVHLSGIQDSNVTIGSILNNKSNGLYAYVTNQSKYGFFNNFIEVNSIRSNGQNGAVFQSPPSGDFGVQGNHIEIGQVFGNGASGIALFGVTVSNYLVVGPIEWNKSYGCYQEQGPNTWVIVNSNSNKKKDVC